MTNDPKISLGVEKVLSAANEEAARLHHEYVGAEHILLALVADGEGIAVAALRNLGVDLALVRTKIETTITRGASGVPPSVTRPLTSRTKRAFELAGEAANSMGHTYLGTEHLLLGLMAESKNIAAQILASLGIQVDATRTEIQRLLGPLPQS